MPSEFGELKKTYQIIKSVPWAKRHPKYYFANIGISPIAIICEAIDKDLPLPPLLKKLIARRYERELTREKENVKQPKNNSQEQSLINRERNNYLKGIGILVAILIDEKAKSSRNPDIKFSASQIAKLIVEKAENLEIDTSGLKSFDRKISEAIELINQEANIEITL